MHSMVVLWAGEVVFHMSGLNVHAHQIIVIGGSRFPHAAKGLCIKLWTHDLIAYEPVSFVCTLVSCLLSYYRAKDVREMLVKGTGLAIVDEVTIILGDSVTYLMSDHIKRFAETREDFSITISKCHALPIPECIGKILAK